MSAVAEDTRSDRRLKGRNKLNHPRRALAAEKQRKVLELRLAGISFQAISDQLAIPKTTVVDAYNRALQDSRDEIAQNLGRLRAQECARLDRYLSKLKKAIDEGDQMAIHRATKISERRARLLGIDAQPEPYGFNPNPGTGLPPQIAVVFIQTDNKLTTPPKANGNGAHLPVTFVDGKSDE